MNLLSRDAQCFLAVAESKSLNQAARQRGVTPAALSIAISRLEKSLQSRLFERGIKGIQLTPQGRALKETLTRVSQDLDFNVRKALGDQKLPYLRIGAGYDDHERYLQPALSQIKKDLPPLKVFCRSSRELYRAVEDGRLDFAWVAWPREPEGSLEARPVRPQTGGIVACKKTWGHLRGVKTRRQLNHVPLVMIPRDPEPAWASLLDLKTAGYIVRDFALVRKLVLEGEALGDVEYDLFSPTEFKQLFIVLPDKDEDPYTYLVYRSDLSAPVRQLMENLLEVYLKLVKQRSRG